MKPVSTYWLYGSDISSIQSHEPKGLHSICIDNDPIVESMLRLVLNNLGLVPDESMLIHCWSTQDKQEIYFLNDLQNSYLKGKYPTACTR
jgi:hypothetical protein